MTIKENIEELIKEANELREYTKKLEGYLESISERLEEVLKR
jgi:predicted nuclease with TOPRIM domain